MSIVILTKKILIQKILLMIQILSQALQKVKKPLKNTMNQLQNMRNKLVAQIATQQINYTILQKKKNSQMKITTKLKTKLLMTRKKITNKIKTHKVKKRMKVSMKYQLNLTQDITLVKNGVQIILEKTGQWKSQHEIGYTQARL